MPRTPLSYNEIDADGLATVLKSYHDRDHQDIVHDFEQLLGEVVGCAHVAAVQSGTAAMHLALSVVGVKAGDVVMAPTFVYVASVSPVLYLGAEPVLIDSEAVTWNMDPVLLEEAIVHETENGKRVGAIVVVHNYGMPAQVDRILTLAKKYSIPVVEDAAESFGSRFQGRWTGTLGDVGVYSFNNNKTITGFGGGALVSSNPEMIRRAAHLGSHARVPIPYYQHEEPGYNYRMSPLTAAYGLLQLNQRKTILQSRKEVDDHYRLHAGKKGFQFQTAQSGMDFQPWITACLLPSAADPAIVLDRLQAQGIETRRTWKPMHLQPLFKGAPFYGSGVSEKLFTSGLCLPSGSTITTADQSRVTEIILDEATT